MTTKEYLGQIYKLTKLIESKKIELESYKELATGVSSSNFEEKFNTSRNITPSFVKYIGEIIEIQKEIDSDMIKLENLKSKIRLEINKLENTNERIILIYRHLMFMNWGRISEKIGYSKRWVYKIYNRAVDNFSKIIK